MNDRQYKVFQYLTEFIKKNSYPPSVREIQKGVGIKSTSTVSNDLNRLEELGYIKKSNLKSRSIEIIDSSNETLENYERKDIVDIPLLGNVAAGVPIYATENIEYYFPLPAHLVNKGEYFMLKITGDSMIDAGIFDEDIILVKKTNYANHGEIVVALIDDSATVKRLYNQNGQIMLLPENSSMDPIIPNNLEILGKVISLFRENI